MDKFAVYHFAFDGELLGSQSISMSQLSERWLGVSKNLLNELGPIFSTSLGSTLERFNIECTAGICTFRVEGTLGLSAVILPEAPKSQAAGALASFIAPIRNAKPLVEHCADLPAFIACLESIAERPVLIVINWLNPAIAEQDRAAVFQFALHFAGAYLQWQRTELLLSQARPQ